MAQLSPKKKQKTKNKNKLLHDLQKIAKSKPSISLTRDIYGPVHFGNYAKILVTY
jgi:hypothetical protein